MSSYWNDADKKDQEFRRQINAGTIYTDDASCDCCGRRLLGCSFDCLVCNLLLCTLCICADGCCLETLVPSPNPLMKIDAWTESLICPKKQRR